VFTQYLIAFIVLLGVLVFVHELGHFLAARLFKIRVEVFSMGFGPKLLAWKRKDTEYRISAVPLGGYVKLFGEDPTAEISSELARYSFAHQPPWKRAIVVAAGPLSNFFLPLLILAGIYMVGYPEMAPVIGRVKPGYQAYKAGLLAGDRIKEVDGEAVSTWDELAAAIREKVNEPVELLVEREGWQFSVQVQTVEGEGTDIFGDPERVGLIGIRSDPYMSIIGVSDIYGVGYVAGLRTGDEVIAVDGEPIEHFFELERKVWPSPDEQLVLKVKRGEEELDVAVKPRARVADDQCRWYAKEGLCGELDVEPAVFYVNRVLPDTPAERAGIQPGDRVFSVDGERIWEIEGFIEKVQSSAGQTLELGVLREGKIIEMNVAPAPERTTDFLGRVRTIGKIGVEFYPSLGVGFMEPLKLGFARSFVYAAEKNVYWTRITLEAFWRIVAGRISFRSVGGPIMIAKLAGEAASLGWLPYLFLMAIISLNLFVINLFPVPALDGGMLILLAVESIRRKPIEVKVLEAYQKVGFALLMLLVVLVFYNDISRYWADIGEAIKGVFR